MKSILALLALAVSATASAQLSIPDAGAIDQFFGGTPVEQPRLERELELAPVGAIRVQHDNFDRQIDAFLRAPVEVRTVADDIDVEYIASVHAI